MRASTTGSHVVKQDNKHHAEHVVEQTKKNTPHHVTPIGTNQEGPILDFQLPVEYLSTYVAFCDGERAEPPWRQRRSGAHSVGHAHDLLFHARRPK